MATKAPAPGLAADMKILVPGKGVDLTKWCVVACDQFTSQPEYWARAEALVGTAPSTLRIIYPEVYLNEAEPAKAQRIAAIQQTMRDYLAAPGLLEPAEWPVYVERTVLGRTHRGIVLAVDLENYEFVRNATTLIRPTEETIVERLPPRMRIRNGAPLESPHILLLIDDAERTVVEPLTPLARAGTLSRMYSTELMLDGGRVEGFRVDGEAREKVFAALARLATPEVQRAKYGEAAAAHPLVYAVGDGNHSLATAKRIWEERKAAGDDPASSPARYALVELCNVHDEALVFEPIHRVFEGPACASLLDALKAHFGARFSFEAMPADRATHAVIAHGNVAPHKFAFVSAAVSGVVTIADPDKTLVVATVQPALDAVLKANPGKLAIDYVHGEDVVLSLGTKDPEHCGILLPPMAKSDLFKTVVSAGLVPRKTFSMGHAVEKRYYLECRRIL